MVTQLWLGDWVVGLTKSFQVWGVWESEWKWSKITQLCLTLWNPMDYTVHGILHTKILEWVAFSFLIYARPASVRSECHWGEQEQQWDKYHVWVDVNLSWGLTGNDYLLLSKVYWKYHSTAEKTQMAPRSVLKFIRTAGWVTCRLDRPPKSRSFSISFVSGSTSMISCSRAEMSGTCLSLSLLLLQLDGDSSHRASLNPLQQMCDVACLLGSFLLGIMAVSARTPACWCGSHCPGACGTSQRPRPPFGANAPPVGGSLEKEQEMIIIFLP